MLFTHSNCVYHKKKTWFSSPRCRLDRPLPRGGCRNLRGPRLRPARDSLSPMTFHRWHSYPQIMGFPLGLAILNQIWQAKITRIMYTSTYIYIIYIYNVTLSLSHSPSILSRKELAVNLGNGIGKPC